MWYGGAQAEFHLAQADEVEAQREAEQAGNVAYAALVADPGLVVKNQTILDSI